MPPISPQQTLKDVFGFDDFRGGQQAVVTKVLAGHSTAAIFATGAGKSLCYQLAPTALNPGGVTVAGADAGSTGVSGPPRRGSGKH